VVLPPARGAAARASAAVPTAGTAAVTPAIPAGEPAGLLRFEEVREHPRVRFYVRKADEALAEIGYTEHGERHVGLVRASPSTS
jgi:hypothetical protein